jgi:hypothetical protein
VVADMVQPPDSRVYLSVCDAHVDLVETLQESQGKYAAIGLYPPWHMPDNEKMISALVPLPDGTLKRGVY